MKYVIREMSWYKRRTPTKELLPVEILNISPYELIRNHPCDMEVLCDDGKSYMLSARVHHNTIKDTWTIQGLNPTGLSVVVDLEEE